MTTGSFRDYVEAVRARADIVEIVGEVVQLRRSGSSLIGLCPFHQEKTGSFNVSATKQLYYCHGCQAGGDVFKFVREIHRLDFNEAVVWLGDRYGIPRPAPRTPQEAAQDRRRQRLVEALQQAQVFFTSNLKGSQGLGAREYLQRRGLPTDRALGFGLGYAPSAWDGLLRHLTGRGFSPEELILSGLVVPSSEGRAPRDRFRDRVTFPIRDTAGRVISFGGRALGDDEPKYLNGSETTLYDKSRTLFRFFEVAQESRKSGRAVVVEGYFDAVSLAAAGVPGAVAVCGTALGAGHTVLLKRLADKVVLFFDGDTAGRKAAHRALGPLLEAGLAVQIGCPPDGQDPDDLARKGGAEAVEHCLAEALDLPEFLIAEAKREFDLASHDGMIAASDMVLGHLARVGNELARVEAADRVALGLGWDERGFKKGLKEAARKRLRELPRTALEESTPSRIRPGEAEIVRFLGGRAGENPEAAARLLEELPEAVRLGPLRVLWEGWIAAHARGENPDHGRLAEMVPPALQSEVVALAFAPGPEPDLAEARRALKVLKIEELKEQQLRLQRAIEQSPDPEEQGRLLGQKLSLAQQIHGLWGQPC